MDGLCELINALSNGTIPDPLRPPLPQIWGLQLSYPLLSQEQVKLRASNFVGTFIGSIGTKKNMKNVGNSIAVGVVRESRKFRAPVYRAHRAVIFATAQLSC